MQRLLLPVRGADALNVALSRIRQLEQTTEMVALWKIHYQTQLLLHYVLNSPSLLQIFHLYDTQKIECNEFKCKSLIHPMLKSVCASLVLGCVLVGIWHCVWLIMIQYISSILLLHCRNIQFHFQKAPQGWIKVVLSSDWMITASNVWKDKYIPWERRH